MRYYTQINEAKRTFQSAKAIYDRLRKRADTLEAQMSRTGNKMPYPGHQKDMGPVKGALDSFIKYYKETDRPSTADIPNSYTKSLERAEKALDRIEKKQKDNEAKQGALKSKYEAGKAKEAKEKRGLSGTYVSDSFDFKQRTRQYLGLNEMAKEDLDVSIEELAKMSGSGLKKEAAKYVENKREKKEGITDRAIKQGLGSTFTQAKKKEIITPEKVKEFQDAVREYIKNNPQKEEEKVEESTRYRRNFR